MEQTSNSKRFLTWGIFVVIVGLVIWGLIAAQQKQMKEEANLVLPTQVVETDHSRGSTIAPVTLIEYGDFQCPACATYHPIVEQLVKEMGADKLRFIFRHFPLAQHGNAVPASLAAEAAGVQGKFWEMYNMLYERQENWETAVNPKAVFVGYALEMGLDQEKFEADYESDALEERIMNDYKGGAKGGINSTPTFFVNGKKVTPTSYDEFKKILSDAATTTAQ